MWRYILTLSALLALASTSIWPAQVEAHQKPLADYDPKTLVVVVNRDSSDVTIIDPATDEIIQRIALGEFTNAHMAMLNHDGKKLLVSATGRDRFLVVDLVTGKIEHTVVTGKSPEHFDVSPDGRRAFVGNIEDSTVSVIDVHEGREVKRVEGFFAPHGFSVYAGRRQSVRVEHWRPRGRCPGRERAPAQTSRHRQRGPRGGA